MKSKRAAADDGIWRQVKGHFTEAFAGEMLFLKSRGDGEVRRDWRDQRWRSAYRYVLILFAAVFLPVIVYMYYADEMLLVSAVAALGLPLLVDIILLSLGREALLSPAVFLVGSIGLSLAAVYVGQDFALYFLYPLLVSAPILVRWRFSISICLGTQLLIFSLVLERMQPIAAFVIPFSLGLAWLVSTWLAFSLTQQAKRLRDMAITDPLTGAYNRRYLEQRAAKSLEDWARYERHESLLLIDIDYFKRINDKFGHSVGDRALQELVRMIRQRVRAADTLCRFGGEEFVLLLSEANAAVAERVANKLRREVERARILPEGSITLSIGICDVSCATSVEHWFKLADAALYLAKSNGRNRVEVATTEPVVIASHTHTLPVWR
tara:strand:+ start:3714 stop:4853 length:1140 start_codon:yes stop_codon:yes gene_type:complete